MTTRNGAPETRREALNRWASAVGAAAIQRDIPAPPTFSQHTVFEDWSAKACMDLAESEHWPTANVSLHCKAGDSVLSALNQLNLPER